MDVVVEDFVIFQKEELGKPQKNLRHNFSVLAEM